MTKSIDGLCAIIQDQLKIDPSSNCLYLFCDRRRDRIKAILHENDGFVLLDKRLTGIVCVGIIKIDNELWERSNEYGNMLMD